MQLDHLSYAAGPDGLASTALRLADLLGEKFVDGGIHPRFGTTNMILPLAGRRYLEVVEVLDHPASDKAHFGRAARAMSKAGGGWLGWVVRVDDLSTEEARLGRTAEDGNRHRPDGAELRWRQFGTSNLHADPQLPVFIQWQTPEHMHPSCGASGDLTLASVEIAGDVARVTDWLGSPADNVLGDVDVDWVDGGDRQGLVAASFTTPGGIVRI